MIFLLDFFENIWISINLFIMHSYGLTRLPPPTPYTNTYGEYSLYANQYPTSQRHHSL